MKKRLLSLAAALIMAESLLPTAALAGETAYEKLAEAVKMAPTTGERTEITQTGDVTGMTTDQILTIAADRSMVLDMAGYTIAADTIISKTAYSGGGNYGSLTIKNGIDKGDADAGGAFSVKTMFASGAGTEKDPYVISDEAALNALRQSVAGGSSYAGKYFVLGDNITLTADWIPIGSQDKPFSGTFDGAGNTISGMKIEAASGYTGFFGYLSDARVNNLTIEDALITCADDAWVGVLAGYAGGSTITDCSVSGEIKMTEPAVEGTASLPGLGAAGVVEYLYQSTVPGTNSAVNISVSGSGAEDYVYVGGIACEVNNSRIENCGNTGSLLGCSKQVYSYVGGIAAYTKNSSRIIGCTNSGAVVSGDETAAVYAASGGILGQVWYESKATERVSGNTNSGDVTAAARDGNSYAGGIVGESYQYNPDPADADYWSEATRSTITISGNTNSGTVDAAGAAGAILGWGDAEWKLSLASNTAAGGQEHAGDFGAPADMTFADQDTYDYWDGCFHAFQVMRLEFNPTGDALIPVGSEQTLVVVDGVDLSNPIQVQPGGQLVVEAGATLQAASIASGGQLVVEAGATLEDGVTIGPGGQLMAEEGADVDNVTVDGGGYLVTFRNDGVDLGRFATEADGTVHFPDQPAKDGYVFAGWYTDDGICVCAGGKVTGNVTLTARWTKVTEPDAPSAGGDSSLDDDGDYIIRLSGSTDHGRVLINPGRADEGDTVTLTVKPDEGYELGRLTALDKSGDEIRLTSKGDDKYTFTMPGGNVTVEAAFVKSGAEATLPFTDVAMEAYYYDAVRWAVESDVTQGVTATTFQPGAACTRAQTVTFLWRAAGCPSPKTTANPFTDVSESDYCYEAVLWAAENGITGGTTATTFSPGMVCTRAQVVTFLYRYSGGETVSGGSFGDVAADAYYADAVAWAVANGITNGTTAATFSPDTPVSRAQAVTFLYRELA